MKKYKSIAGITLMLAMAVLVFGSCSSPGKYACPNKIEILP